MAERLVLIGAHVRHREVAPVITSGVLALAMAFVAYRRAVPEQIL